MRRHQPTLYALAENESPDPQDQQEWIQSPVARATRHRSKTTSARSKSIPDPPQQSKYPDIYSQFVKRYRSSQQTADDDPTNDPDSHYFQRGLGQLIDAGDSDDEDIPRLSLGAGTDTSDRLAPLMPNTEPNEATTMEERERLEWQAMLASVLSGDVLRSEKTRIAVALESSNDEHNNNHLSIWLGIRAKIHGRSEEEERERLEERRLRLVPSIIEEINAFEVTYPFEDFDTDYALKQVTGMLRRLDLAHSLYPNLKAFNADNPGASERVFQTRCDALNTWSTVLTTLQRQIALLRRWTGSDSLDVSQPYTNHEVPIASKHTVNRDGTEVADRTSFVERLLKEEDIQRTFEKGSLTTIHGIIGMARDAQVNLASIFEEMKLPTFERELVPLISFPTKLAQAGLLVRLDYVQKLKDPEILIIDQVTEDLKLSIGLACTLKRQYEAFLTPDQEGKWNLPSCISEDYDLTILEALRMFFKLMHWKLKSGAKAIYFKETDVLEAQWATFNDVSASTIGGSSLVAEQLCALTNKLMIRVSNYFDTQVRVPVMENSVKEGNRYSTSAVNGTKTFRFHADARGVDKMSNEQTVQWYAKILESVRLRYRKLQRFARVLTHKFSNSAEYSLEGVLLETFIASLVATDHFLVYTQAYEEEGTYIIASSGLRDRHDTIRRILIEAFHVEEMADDDDRTVGNGDEYDEEGNYLLVLSPRSQFLWNGLVLVLGMRPVDFGLKDNRVRLIADGPQRRLSLAKQSFDASFIYEEDVALDPAFQSLTCLAELQAHLPSVNRELRRITRATNKLAESIANSVHQVRESLRTTGGYQELLESWYLFASEHGQHALKNMDRSAIVKFNPLLIKLAISWVSFICDDCEPTDRKTFKWAVNALEFTFGRTKRNNILYLPDRQFELMRQKVASCMTLLISHFDILGARSTLEATREKEKQEEDVSKLRASELLIEEEEGLRSRSPESKESFTVIDNSTRAFWEKVSKSLHELDKQRSQQRTLGRVLDDEKPEDRSLVFLASASLNFSVRWKQGRFIGAGAFGSVYLAVNLDSGSLMAVKEIKFQELAGLPSLITQIKDELSIMEMLHHPNVVEYYGIEVHRDRVYIFEEYCQGGSLAALLEHGRIEDEGIIQVYTMQMLEGLAYLHSRGIVHRDIKPDNILLDHLGVIKFVDFGASKILAKNQRSIQRSRRAPMDVDGFNNGLQFNNSLTGTPMYMSPEVIKNDKRGRHGAMDIWSLGCVVLEFATGKKPWSNLDNEWAIMFHIGVATQHPPLPEPGQLSDLGISFIKKCLTIDPLIRPNAIELMDHQWMVDFRDALLGYEEAENANNVGASVHHQGSGSESSTQFPEECNYENATVARQAAIMLAEEVETIKSASPVVDSPPSDSGSSAALSTTSSQSYYSVVPE